MTTHPEPALLRAAAGALIQDAAGRVLLVHPLERECWEIPGGVVERDESPPEAAERELLEELGLALRVGRLLVVDYVSPRDGHDGLLNFVFEGPQLNEEAEFVLPPEELDQACWVRPTELDNYLIPRMAARIRVSLEARHQKTAHYLNSGTTTDER
ncbi:NUDIX hydrolase [Saccharopolyspora sp. K220]|uniref:NUDIX domain-containing protein n=1 Tax=Saccharopolyspora soli TaxID=2926618 RepID=UPI001F564577|nr:NUDIX hydrolase [Saccharopolyspora soli]MCI2423574.1 NUDIX hydrolase [Saccharopolyspora soli]